MHSFTAEKVKLERDKNNINLKNLGKFANNYNDIYSKNINTTKMNTFTVTHLASFLHHEPSKSSKFSQNITLKNLLLEQDEQDDPIT